MNGKELLEILTKHGWKLDRIKGSHHIMVKSGQRSVPIPVHGAKDLHPHLVSAILKQAGLKNS